MGRSWYVEDFDDNWTLIRWRGAVKSAIRGKRGQQFFSDLIAALDALPDKRLIAAELEKDGEVCALGSVGRLRGMDMGAIDPEDYEQVSAAFGLPEALVREVEYVNDEYPGYRSSPEERYRTVRAWAANQLRSTDE